MQKKRAAAQRGRERWGEVRKEFYTRKSRLGESYYEEGRGEIGDSDEGEDEEEEEGEDDHDDDEDEGEEEDEDDVEVEDPERAFRFLDLPGELRNTTYTIYLSFGEANKHRRPYPKSFAEPSGGRCWPPPGSLTSDLHIYENRKSPEQKWNEEFTEKMKALFQKITSKIEGLERGLDGARESDQRAYYYHRQCKDEYHLHSIRDKDCLDFYCGWLHEHGDGDEIDDESWIDEEKPQTAG